MHTVGGRVRLLLAVDREGLALFDGDPVLLAEHRPGADPEELLLEGPDALPARGVRRIWIAAHRQLADLVVLAFDEQGSFDGQRVLGHVIDVSLPARTFDT